MREQRVEIDCVLTATFRQVSGLRCKTEVVEWREAGDAKTIEHGDWTP